MSCDALPPLLVLRRSAPLTCPAKLCPPTTPCVPCPRALPKRSGCCPCITFFKNAPVPPPLVLLVRKSRLHSLGSFRASLFQKCTGITIPWVACLLVLHCPCITFYKNGLVLPPLCCLSAALAQILWVLPVRHFFQKCTGATTSSCRARLPLFCLGRAAPVIRSFAWPFVPRPVYCQRGGGRACAPLVFFFNCCIMPKKWGCACATPQFVSSQSSMLYGLTMHSNI